MKKLFLTLTVFFISVSAFAQTTDTNTQEKATPVGKYPMSAGGFFHIAAPVDMQGKTIYDVGGGFGGTFKVNFFRWLALRTDVTYMYTAGKRYSISSPFISASVKSANYHALEIKELLVFQYETPLGKSGVAPWIGIGPAISLGTYNGVGVGFGAGANYNFANNAYVGVAIDLVGYVGGTSSVGGNDTFKFAIEAGYRF